MKRISHHAAIAAGAASSVFGSFLYGSVAPLHSADSVNEVPSATIQHANSVNLPTAGIESLTTQVAAQLADVNKVAFDVPVQVEGDASSVVTAGVSESTLAGNFQQYSESLEAQADARTGDVIQYDVGGNGMNHTTIVTFYDTVSQQPLLTYHSTDTHNIPLSAFIAKVKSEAGTSSYQLYAWRT